MNNPNIQINLTNLNLHSEFTIWEIFEWIQISGYISKFGFRTCRFQFDFVCLIGVILSIRNVAAIKIAPQVPSQVIDVPVQILDEIVPELCYLSILDNISLLFTYIRRCSILGEILHSKPIFGYFWNWFFHLISNRVSKQLKVLTLWENQFRFFVIIFSQFCAITFKQQKLQSQSL